MGLDLTSFDNALKVQYSRDFVENLTYKDNPFLGLISKDEGFKGKNKEILFVYSNPQSRAASFSRAQARSLSSNSKLGGLFITRVADYGVAVIDNQTLLASQGDSAALMEAATTEIDGVINALTRSVATSLFKSGYGDIGQIKAATAVNGLTLTLSNPDDITNFEVGQELEAAATQTGVSKALGSGGNGLIVTAVDRSAGTIGFASNANDAVAGIPTLAAGDYLFVRGDHNAAVRSKIAGVEAWIPSVAPIAGDNFFGLDRSADVTRLAGNRLNAVGAPIEEVLIDASSQVGREGWPLTHYFMSFAQYSSIEKALGSKVQYIDLSLNAQVAFRGIMINGVRGPIKIVPDMNCPTNRIFGLNMQYWTLHSIGQVPRPIDTDGLSMLRQGSADGVEVRYGYYGQCSCSNPAAQINIQV